ncbi:MAG: transferase [Planctomycetes bacterium]|nr:transferase [Planctomycetota bacterium]
MSDPNTTATIPERPPLPNGETDENPRGLSLRALVAEDFATYDRSFFEPGFWAVLVHRFGNWRMGLRPRLLRHPFTLLYRMLALGVDWMWGINVPYTTKLGRRVRIWYHGGINLGARSIGDDVHIRPNTTMGIMSRHDQTAKPTIEDRCDIGAGACILGHLTVGHDTVVGANSVVVKDVPPNSTVFGVPARPVKLV